MDFFVSNFGKIFLGLIIGVVLFFAIKNYASIVKFLREVRAELIKVSWPTRKEVITSTMVILVLTAFLSVFVGVIDLGLSKLLSLFLK